MTKRYYAPKDYWFDLDTLEIDGKPGKFHNPEPRSFSGQIIKDHEAYKSPVTGEVIDGRTQRREHMKRNNLREVDNTEHKPVYRNPDFYLKRGIHPDKIGAPLERAPRMADVPPPGMDRLLRR